MKCCKAHWANWANWAKANWANSLLHCLFGTFTELHTEKRREKSAENLVKSFFLLYFCRIIEEIIVTMNNKAKLIAGLLLTNKKKGK